MNYSLKPYLLAMLACLIWSGNFVIARAVAGTVPPVALAYGRWLFALIAVAPLALPLLKAQWPVVKKQWKLHCLMGFVGIGCFNTLVYVAAHTTEAQNLSLIACTAPIWIVLLSAVYRHEPFTAWNLVGALISFMGAVLVISRGALVNILHLNFVWGDWLVLLASWIWAIYCIALKKKNPALNMNLFLAVQVFLGVLFLTPFYAWELWQVGWTPLNWTHVLVFAYLGIGASLIAFRSWNLALLELGAQKTGLLYYLTPFFSGVLAWLLLGEPVAWYHMVSLVCIVSGILLSHFKSKRSA